MSGYLALVGRLLFAALFLASGVQKLQTFGKVSGAVCLHVASQRRGLSAGACAQDGGPGLDLLSPKIDTVLG